MSVMSIETLLYYGTKTGGKAVRNCPKISRKEKCIAKLYCSKEVHCSIHHNQTIL